MNIAKVSKYVPVVTATSGGRDGSGVNARNMLVSIPRVEFLEKDRENTEFYHKYLPVQDMPVVSTTLSSREWITRITQPMTEREKVIEQMLNEGKTYKQICAAIGLAKGTIATYVYRIRAKRAYLLVQEENAKASD